MSIEQDPQRGTWYFVTRVTAADGSRHQMKRRGFATKKLATSALAAVVSDQARGTFVRPSRVTVERFLIDEWLPAKASGLKPSTAASYAQMVDSYVVPRISVIELAKVNGGVLNTLYANLLSDGRTGGCGRPGGLAPKSVRNIHGMLHRAFRDAVRWGRLAVNPCDSADQPRKQDPEMKAWTSGQLGRFITFTAADRLGPVWRLVAVTGMRRGELLGLRWSDIDLDAARLTIRQTITMVDSVAEVGTPKTRAGARSIALDPGTVVALKVWKRGQIAEQLVMGAGWRNPTGLVVTEPDGAPVHPRAITRRFQAIAVLAKLPLIRLHDVRHSYATAALAAGVPIKVLSQRLGHADVAVTLRVYAHVLPGDDESAANVAAAAITAGM